MTNENRYSRTDLACEAAPELIKLDGVNQTRRSESGFEILTTEILTERSAEKIGKPIGRYHTVFVGSIHNMSDDKRDDLTSLLENLVKNAVSTYTDRKNFSFLVAGLGNRHLTADALGPLTVEKTTVTRELRYSSPDLFNRIGCSCVSAIAPGVSAETGIEAADIIKGAADAVSPDVIILIDALAARSCSRLASTIQISDKGIYPGSGIGNRRTPITSETMDIPVITIGIPTVVDSSSLVYDALNEGGIDTENLSDELTQVLSNGRSFFVSPKDCDVITEDFSTLIAYVINRISGIG